MLDALTVMGGRGTAAVDLQADTPLPVFGDVTRAR